jgi:hypothetical protein
MGAPGRGAGRDWGRDPGGPGGRGAPVGGALGIGLRSVSAAPRSAPPDSTLARDSTPATACSARSPAGPRSAGAGRLPPAPPAEGAGAAFSLGAAPLVVAGLLASTGSSGGCSLRTRPSLFARRRTRSACASSIPEECVLTPMPSANERSRHSLFVSPSSLASSWTRIFAAKFFLTSPSSCRWARTAHESVRIAVPYPRAVRVTGTNTGLTGTRAGCRLRSS